MDRIKSQNKLKNDEERLKAKSSLINKVNNQVQDDLVVSKVSLNPHQFKEDAINNEPIQEENEEMAPLKVGPNKPKKIKRKFFFFRLSFIAKVMLIIYIIGFSVLGVLAFDFVGKRGNPVTKGRTLPTKEISSAQVDKIKAKLKTDIPADSIEVDLKAYRLIITIDLANDATVEQATAANTTIISVIDSIIPISEYFTGTDDGLGNDFTIYATDIIPKNSEENSRFILETYKNSRMAAPATFNLMDARDKASYDRVMETYKKVEEGK